MSYTSYNASTRARMIPGSVLRMHRLFNGTFLKKRTEADFPEGDI